MPGRSASPGCGSEAQPSSQMTTEQQLDVAASAHDRHGHDRSAAIAASKGTNGVQQHLPPGKGQDTLELTAAAALCSSSIGEDSSEVEGKDHNPSTLLAPIPLEHQLNLRWERICAYVSTNYDEAGVLTKTVQRCRGQPVVKHEKKQVRLQRLRCSASELKPMVHAWAGQQCRG